jgi:hypothetical protein
VHPYKENVVMIKKLKNNNIVFGEMSLAERELMYLIGTKQCVVRRKDGWWPCVSDSFKRDKTYRISNRVKIVVTTDYKEWNGLWGVEMNGRFITYDSSVAIINIDGHSVRFLGFDYNGKIKSDLLDKGGALPSSGMWEVLDVD